MEKLKTGMCIGKYRILRPLGKGGEGSVWLVLHTETEQLWAMKYIPRSDGLREFHELEMMKRLRHPSLPVITDLVCSNQAVCLIMEYVRGQTLRTRLQEGRRPGLQEVLHLGICLCEVLSYLHSRSTPVWHLDVKPENILLLPSDRLKLVDFGSALQANLNTDCFGTPGYAAPEQRKAGSSVDGRADLYALGSVLYEMISGVRYGSFMKKSRIPGCPGSLEGILKKCLQEDPADRYQNALALEKDLNRLWRMECSKQRRLPVYPAIVLVMLSFSLAGSAMQRELAVRTGEQKTYEDLIREASCAKDEQSIRYYREALFLSPARKEAYLQLMEQMGEDGVFSLREEETLRSLLHEIPVGSLDMYEELLRENPSGYLQVCWQAALLYWFESDLPESRRIAAGWLKKCRETMDEMEQGMFEEPAWIPLFRVLYSMSQSYAQPEETDSGRALTYWKGIQAVFAQKVCETLNTSMRLLFYTDTCNQLVFFLPSLKQEGIATTEMELLLQNVQEGLQDPSIREEDGRLTGEALEALETVQRVLGAE